ncbi:MAG: F0F1 ATP synthase subunit delta [Zoogloeaceae bacterium]|jgi:F-type H+-transporting ATPase subunit delta|nr:F0F1 ATP synthase subunit delta [Zoogloeaceae bacterium]
MAESVTVARPYAEAAFRAAKEKGALNAWNENLQRLALAAQDRKVVAVIGSPVITVEQLVDFFLGLLEQDKQGKQGNDPVFCNFVKTLAENERLTLLPEIASLFAAEKAAEEGIREAVVASAFPLSEPDLKTLLPQLEAHFKTKLAPVVKVDADLIGGVRVTVGDQVLDASVRGKLDAMTIALRN